MLERATLDAACNRVSGDRLAVLLGCFGVRRVVSSDSLRCVDTVRPFATTARVPVELVDERYTSLEADRVLAGRRKDKGRRDAVAAALLLQTWLDGSGRPGLGGESA